MDGELGPDDFERCLADARQRLGRYGWMLKLLRARGRRSGKPTRRLQALLSRFYDPANPYFIGHTADGVAFLGDFGDNYSLVVATCPDWDCRMTRFLQREMPANGAAYLDIGANCGIVAASMARALQGRAEVVAFEPIPETARRAAATFALNGVANARLLTCALAEEDGEITFYNAPGNSELASAVASEQPGVCVETRAPCVTLDSLRAADRIGPVGLIKMDVEGYELNVLRGAEKLIARDRPKILFEYNYTIAPAMGWKVTDASDQITRSGREYAFQVLRTHEDAAPQPFPPPPDTPDLWIDVFCTPTDGRAAPP